MSTANRKRRSRQRLYRRTGKRPGQWILRDHFVLKRLIPLNGVISTAMFQFSQDPDIEYVELWIDHGTDVPPSLVRGLTRKGRESIVDSRSGTAVEE